MVARGEWTRAAIELLERLMATQGDADRGQRRGSRADTIASGGLVHMFGTGHSRMAVEEMFPRYGSFPGFHPLVELSTTFHTQVVGANGQRQAMFIERVEGLAEVILSNFTFGADDAMIVCSTGGVTANPIEMAMGGRSRGLPVVAITAVEHSKCLALPALLGHAAAGPRGRRHRPRAPRSAMRWSTSRAWMYPWVRDPAPPTSRSSTRSRSRRPRSWSSGAPCRPC